MADASALLLIPTNSAPTWRRSTPPELIRAFESGDARKFARAIRRSAPFPQLQRTGRRRDGHPHQQALWSQHAFPASDRSRELAELLAAGFPSVKSPRKSRERRTARIAALLDQYEAGPAPDGFELLAWMSLLAHEPQLSDELCLRLWTAIWHGMQPVLETSPKLAGQLTADQRALLLGELPWSYGIIFSTVRGARGARQQAAKQLRRELLEVCDDDGMPHAHLLRRLPLCVAPFTRAANLGDWTGNDWWNRATHSQYRKLVLRTVALLLPDGRTALSNGVAPQAGALLQSASARAGLKDSHHAALLADLLAAPNSAAESKKLCARTSVAPRLKRKHRPSAQSDRAQLACLRNNWGVGADACIIAFDGPTPRIDLTAFGVPVLSGDWGCADADGQPATGVWECVCWFSDANVDYVELQNVGSDGRRVLRQALLSRDDHFLLLCDAAHGGNEGKGVQHRMTLPLHADASAERDALTRQWELRVGPLRMRALPLGLPQAAIHRADGSLTIDGHSVTLTQSTTAAQLACPLLLDWSPARRKAPVQWRQLTVAEDGRILNAGEALGVRWRIGDAQWLYFHTLDGSDLSRTVLGMHTLQETVIAELNSRGNVEHLVQVEPGTNEE